MKLDYCTQAWGACLTFKLGFRRLFSLLGLDVLKSVRYWNFIPAPGETNIFQYGPWDPRQISESVNSMDISKTRVNSNRVPAKCMSVQY